jgi:hypothetical protein
MPSNPTEGIFFMRTDSDQERFLSRSQQAARYGKSIKTIGRWAADPELGFPKEIDINGHKFRRLSELEEFERSRVGVTSTRGYGFVKKRKRT